MIIWWGSSSSEVDLGFLHFAECQTCGAEKPQHVYCSYTYTHVYTIFRYVSSETYYSACVGCGMGHYLDKDAVLDTYGDALAADRYGCLVALTALAVFMVLAALGR